MFQKHLLKFFKLTFVKSFSRNICLCDTTPRALQTVNNTQKLQRFASSGTASNNQVSHFFMCNIM